MLAAECGDDDQLRAEVESLLRANEAFAATPAAAPAEAAGARIGPYRLLEQIGEGGFGAVWVAEQEGPLRRRVALKVLKPGMDSRQIEARFEQERQALALMDHPNIAKVFDAGATPRGRPYFVMELVKGVPITDYCDRHKLPMGARLLLFMDVCRAVQHAHGRGLIHRDINPRNVLVSTQDGRPAAKVIDFGIAKAMGRNLTDKTLFTEHHAMIGTLAYMSPEQAEGAVDIDARTDVLPTPWLGSITEAWIGSFKLASSMARGSGRLNVARPPPAWLSRWTAKLTRSRQPRELRIARSQLQGRHAAAPAAATPNGCAAAGSTENSGVKQSLLTGRPARCPWSAELPPSRRPVRRRASTPGRSPGPGNGIASSNRPHRARARRPSRNAAHARHPPRRPLARGEAGRRPCVPGHNRDAGCKRLVSACWRSAALPSRSMSLDGAPPPLPDGYEFVRELGRGGMGVVHLVRERSLGRTVALKLLASERGAVPELVARFRDEARALGRLRHPNLVVVHAVGDFNGVPYFTMDFVEGESLADLLTRSVRLPLPRCLAILQDVCAGVDHAHRHGVVHRDLTPGNVLLDREGRALVTDFGLARDQQASARLTQTGVVMGTPAYMAPEQAHGDHARVGPATDVHAIGAILHECLVGQPPFGNGSTAEVIVRVMHDDPASIRSIDRRIPRDVESVVAKALAKRPEGRYPTVHALANDLARCARGEPVLARPITVAQRGRRWLRRHPLLGAATAGIVVGAVFLGFLRDDRSVAELIALGRQQVADGEPRAAAAAWRRALPRAGNEEKARLRDAARAAMEQADTLDARVDLGVVAVIADRDVPLGAVEPAVLGALLAPVRLSYRASADDTTWLGPSSLELLELVRHRCNLALAGDASGVAADVARELLPQLQMLASRGFPAPGTTTWTRTSVGGIRSRAEAALAAAAAEPDRAREFVLLAWRLLRTRHPVLDGGFLSVVPMDPEAAPPVHSMCDLARRVHGRLAALDPQEAGESRGGITVSLRGPQVPVGLRFLVVVRFRRIGADAEPDTASDDGHDDDHGLLFGTRVTERFLRVAAGTYELQWRRDTSVGGEGDDLERRLRQPVRSASGGVAIHACRSSDAWGD